MHDAHVHLRAIMARNPSSIDDLGRYWRTGHVTDIQAGTSTVRAKLIGTTATAEVRGDYTWVHAARAPMSWVPKIWTYYPGQGTQASGRASRNANEVYWFQKLRSIWLTPPSFLTPERWLEVAGIFAILPWTEQGSRGCPNWNTVGLGWTHAGPNSNTWTWLVQPANRFAAAGVAYATSDAGARSFASLAVNYAMRFRTLSGAAMLDAMFKRWKGHENDPSASYAHLWPRALRLIQAARQWR